MPKRIDKSLILLFSLLLDLFILSSCAKEKLNIDVKNDVKIPSRKVIVFFADGLRADILHKLADEGRLPNIKHNLIDRGCSVENAITSLPSITYAVTASMQTGKFPGHHHITGNKWFDRFTGKYQDYTYIRTYRQIDSDIKATTIFEALYDKYTITIQTACRRGVSRPIDNWASSGIEWFFGLIKQVDELVAIRFELISQCSNKTGIWPAYIFAYFPAIDEIGHRYSSNSKEYIDAVINFDKQIGKICKSLKQAGLLESTYLILISDHGHVPAQREDYWLASAYFGKKLKIPLIDSMFLENEFSCRRLEYLKNYRMVTVTDGNRIISCHIRTKDSWQEMPENSEEVINFFKKYGVENITEELLGIPAIDLIAIRNGQNSVKIFTKKGSAVILRKEYNGQKLYQYIPGQYLKDQYKGYCEIKSMTGDHDNPLDYPEELCDGRPRSSEDWLYLTCESRYPDFVPQIVEYFDSPRAGDMVIFAAEGYDFSERDLGGHGSVLRADMRIPFIIAGPGIEKKTIKTARIVDLAPTILDLLGLKERIRLLRPLDGISIKDRILAR